MPNLKKMLQGYDLDLLGRIASFWGVDSVNLDAHTLVNNLVDSMQDSQTLKEVIDTLPPNAGTIWESLIHNPQKITWAQLTRKHGEVREFGAARREREAPELHPTSPVEVLWYRGLIGRAFMNLPPEPREFVFIPDELLPVSDHSIHPAALTIQPDIIPESEIIRKAPADSRLIDHVTDWLAARRMLRQLPVEAWKIWRIHDAFISGLTTECGLINTAGEPLPDALPAFFQQNRRDILKHWLDCWKDSTLINDLRQLPGLVFDGQWINDPVKPREYLLELITSLAPDTWFDLKSFLHAVKRQNPDYQRPSGDYDSWFIRKINSEEYLRGFAHWDEVDGALLRYLILGPLHWLGMIDLGVTSGQPAARVFRLSKLLNNPVTTQPDEFSFEKEKTVTVSSDLTFTVPLFASRTLRYQLGRFCELKAISADSTCYEITSSSLQTAQEAGLKVSQLIQLLEKQLKSPLPKNLILIANRWEKHALESTMESTTLLRTRTPEIMQVLRQNPQAAKFVLELLNPTTAIINQAGAKALKRALLEQGILSQINLDV